jgi:hypothetical protein
LVPHSNHSKFLGQHTLKHLEKIVEKEKIEHKKMIKKSKSPKHKSGKAAQELLMNLGTFEIKRGSRSQLGTRSKHKKNFENSSKLYTISMKEGLNKRKPSQPRFDSSVDAI